MQTGKNKNLIFRWKAYQPGMGAHTCNPSTLEAEAGRLPEVRSTRPAWLTWQNPVSTKNTKISQAWWQAPVIPATREAEAGRITWIWEAEVAVSRDWVIALQPGWHSETLPQKKRQTKNKNKETSVSAIIYWGFTMTRHYAKHFVLIIFFNYLNKPSSAADGKAKLWKTAWQFLKS